MAGCLPEKFATRACCQPETLGERTLDLSSGLPGTKQADRWPDHLLRTEAEKLQIAGVAVTLVAVARKAWWQWCYSTTGELEQNCSGRFVVYQPLQHLSMRRLAEDYW